MQTVKIDVSKVDKAALYKGEQGTYLNITLHEYKDGEKYGQTGFVTQDLGAERRKNGEKGAIIGNYKVITFGSKSLQEDEMNDIPF